MLTVEFSAGEEDRWPDRIGIRYGGVIFGEFSGGREICQLSSLVGGIYLEVMAKGGHGKVAMLGSS